MAKSKKLPRSFPTASKKMSAGPVEDLGLQNKIAASRTSAKKLVKGNATPPQIPPQPFAPQAGARVPV